jgi:uncharacterized protein
MKEIDRVGLDLAAIYHSHPTSKAEPSKTDLELAGYPEAVHLIVSLKEPAKPVVRAYRIRAQKSEEVELVVEENEVNTLSIKEKLAKLEVILHEMGSALLAYSGGVDSTFLLQVGQRILGDRLLAVTATSETYPSEELAEAAAMAKEIGARHLVLATSELENEDFVANPPMRCYFCKNELFDKLDEIAHREGLKYLIDGFNVDDMGDFRPGMQAGREHGVRSPLREVGMGKADIRALSKEMGLPTWNKPALACLSSRLPYGVRITRDKLNQIGDAERYLRELGLRQLRVRHHNDIARIEVAPEEIMTIISNAAAVVSKLKELGFLYVTLDLQGYRTGSLNEALSAAEQMVGNR